MSDDVFAESDISKRIEWLKREQEATKTILHQLRQAVGSDRIGAGSKSSGYDRAKVTEAVQNVVERPTDRDMRPIAFAGGKVSVVDPYRWTVQEVEQFQKYWNEVVENTFSARNATPSIPRRSIA